MRFVVWVLNSNVKIPTCLRKIKNKVSVTHYRHQVLPIGENKDGVNLELKLTKCYEDNTILREDGNMQTCIRLRVSFKKRFRRILSQKNVFILFIKVVHRQTSWWLDVKRWNIKYVSSVHQISFVLSVNTGGTINIHTFQCIKQAILVNHAKRNQHQTQNWRR